jgi:hypothetical protein
MAQRETGRKETIHPHGRKILFTVGAHLEFVLFSLFLQSGLLQPLKSNPANPSPKQTRGIKHPTKQSNLSPNQTLEAKREKNHEAGQAPTVQPTVEA